MSANEYHFVTAWRVEGTVEEVSAILGDALGLVRWWRKALGSVGLAIQCKLRLISLVILPSNVPHMGILHKSEPF